MTKYKGVEINTKPTSGMVSAARKALDWRKEYGRGGTAVGVARARDIINGSNLSISTVKRMYSFFARHEVDKQAEGFNSGEEGFPSAGRIAWGLWGGDAGQTWSKRIVDRINSIDDRSYDIMSDIAEEDSDMTDLVHEVVVDEAEESVEEIAIVSENLTEERTETAEVVHRAMSLDASPIDEEKRTVRIAISSEMPVARSFGNEILEHTPEAVDLSFLASGRAPLLLDHDPEKQIGVIESVDLDSSARRLRATVRFGRGALAREAFDDVLDGIRANISVGYSISKMQKDSRDGETYIAKSWKPMEASLVAIPADDSAGVGRSSEQPKKPEIVTYVEDSKMSEVDIAAVEAQARQSASKNAAQILELGAKHNRSDLAQKAISEGRSIEEFRGELLDVIGSTRALEEKEIGLNKQERQQFSLVRAINAMANPTDRRAQEAAAFEFECSHAAAQAQGKTARGIMIPVDVLRNWKRDLNTTDDSNVLSEDFRGSEFIDVLRNSSSVMNAGARMLSGLSGDVAIPKKATASSAAWLAAEGDDVAESEPTFSQVALSPKDLGAFTEVTRRMIQQATVDIESLIRDDLAMAIALGMDLAALSGSGASGQPRGIKNTVGINTVDFGTAPDLVPTFAQVIDMETKVREDNALGNGGAYILNATMHGALKSTEKATNTAQFVIENGGTMNGYRALVSNQVAAGDLYFGDFSQLLVGMWGGLDLLVDPFTNSKSGTILIRAIQTMDCAVRHPTAFCLGNDGGS